MIRDDSKPKSPAEAFLAALAKGGGRAPSAQPSARRSGFVGLRLPAPGLRKPCACNGKRKS